MNPGRAPKLCHKRARQYVILTTSWVPTLFFLLSPLQAVCVAWEQTQTGPGRGNMTPDHLEEGRYRFVRRDVRVPSREKLLSHNHIFFRARGASARVELDDPLGSDVVVFAGASPPPAFPSSWQFQRLRTLFSPSFVSSGTGCDVCGTPGLGTRSCRRCKPLATALDQPYQMTHVVLRQWASDFGNPPTAAQRTRTAAESLLDCAAKMATIKYALDQ